MIRMNGNVVLNGLQYMLLPLSHLAILSLQVAKAGHYFRRRRAKNVAVNNQCSRYNAGCLRSLVRIFRWYRPGCVIRLFWVLFIWDILWLMSGMIFVISHRIRSSLGRQTYSGSMSGHYLYDSTFENETSIASGNPIVGLAQLENKRLREKRRFGEKIPIAISVTSDTFLVSVWDDKDDLVRKYTIGKEVTYTGNNTFVFRKFERCGYSIPLLPVIDFRDSFTRVMILESALEIESEEVVFGVLLFPLPFGNFSIDRHVRRLPIISDTASYSHQ